MPRRSARFQPSDPASLQLLAREWKDRKGLARLLGLAGWSGLFAFRGLAAPGSDEQRYLRWSTARASFQAVIVAAIVGFVGENVYWVVEHKLYPTAITTRWAYWLGEDLPFPRLEKIPPEDSLLDVSSGQLPNPVTFTKPFYLGRTEVTFREWNACSEGGGCNNYHPADRWGRGQQPVIYVNWGDAQSYARWLGAMTGTTCRLPSEAEWEYACRAGTTTEYALPAPEGSDDISGKGLANCDGCGGKWDDLGQTAPVGSFDANAWGLHDMHGNIWEWACGDWEAGVAATAGEGECAARVLRGGSWGYGQDSARCANRVRRGPVNRSSYIGFRVVCSSPIVDR